MAMAKRLGIAQQGVADLERIEQAETIKLATLRRATDALNCDLIYGLVQRTTLHDAAAVRRTG